MPDISVARTIAASRDAAWTIISDPTRMGEWSPENQGAKWLGDATRAHVGAKFRGTNKNGRANWRTTCTVVECVEGESFAFDVRVGPFPISTWAYRLEPDGDATTVIEEWTRREAVFIEKIGSLLIGIEDRKEFNRQSMEVTLANIAAELEAG